MSELITCPKCQTLVTISKYRIEFNLPCKNCYPLTDEEIIKLHSDSRKRSSSSDIDIE